MARREQHTFGLIELLGDRVGPAILDSVDIAGGSTSLRLTTSQAVTSIGTYNVSHKLIINLNGTEYYLPLDQVSSYLASLAQGDIISAATSVETVALEMIRAVNSSAITATTSIADSTITRTRELAMDATTSASSLAEAVLTAIRVFGEDDIVSAGSSVGTPTAERIGVCDNDAVSCATSVGNSTLDVIRAVNASAITCDTQIYQVSGNMVV